MSRVSGRIAVHVAAALGLLLPAAASAATPVEIRIDTARGPVAISDPADADHLIGDLCTDEAAMLERGRPSMPITVTWTADLVWVGRFYPSGSHGPAAVDIPDWVLYPGPRRCDARVVGADALRVLTAHGVPVVGAPATDTPREIQTWGWLVLAVGILAGAVSWSWAARTR